MPDIANLQSSPTLMTMQVIRHKTKDSREVPSFAMDFQLPKFSELANPFTIDSNIINRLSSIDPDAADPLNLFRIHWHNDRDRRGLTSVPAHVLLPSEITGVDCKIVVALGSRFPFIQAHKVLAAYACLLPKLLTGAFNPDRHRAVWPSTGNYCRGGVAISRILGCKSAAILPEGMSQERFAWLQEWVSDPLDIIKTPGTESNVKEIFDACNALGQDHGNIILNQFSEYGNYIAHRAVTGPALARLYTALKDSINARLHSFVASSGSSGTLAAGDYLKQFHGAQICVVEALQCPTILYNGYGEHNIQGIGDKHLPLIHNVFNTDYAIGVSDEATDALNLLFNSEIGKEYLLQRTSLSIAEIESLNEFGLSSIANILACIKLAKEQGLGADDLLLTVATDSAVMYKTEQMKTAEDRYGNNFTQLDAAEVFGRFLMGIGTDHLQELSKKDKERIFNLGYYTWVEQQGVSVDDFDRRREQKFWDGLLDCIPQWDEAIDLINKRTD